MSPEYEHYTYTEVKEKYWEYQGNNGKSYTQKDLHKLHHDQNPNFSEFW